MSAPNWILGSGGFTFSSDGAWSSSHVNVSWPETEIKSSVDPETCVICGSGGAKFFCELCRQVVLDLRQEIIRRMAKELLEMESDG